jgi:hypothetical protein
MSEYRTLRRRRYRGIFGTRVRANLMTSPNTGTKRAKIVLSRGKTAWITKGAISGIQKKLEAVELMLPTFSKFHLDLDFNQKFVNVKLRY